MNIKRVCALWFSPTGGTEKIARFVAGELARRLECPLEAIDFTLSDARREERRFGPTDLLVMASPVYAGRLPNKLAPEYQSKIFGQDTPAVPLCVFGNRNYDEALRELVLLLEGNGFQTAAAAALVSRHAFSDLVGTGRPDEADFGEMRAFAAAAAEKLAGETLPPLPMDRGEVGPYYTPLKTDGTPARFLKARPVTDRTKCLRCGQCSHACPMDSIDPETMEAAGLCIKCQSCIRNCPARAKHFEDPEFLSHVAMLEQNYTRRAENKIFV